MIVYALYGVAALVALAPIAVVLAASPRATAVVYGASLLVTLMLAVVALLSLLDPASSSVTLPLGLPWLGAHFRIDALSAFFLLVVNLGGAAASLFALGYGRHEEAPQRVLPFYPAYLAAMNLVVLADDAFTFLVAWEFMSLTSWALVIAHHREPREHARRLCLSADGELRHAGAAARLRPAWPAPTAITLSTPSAHAHPSRGLGRAGADPGAGRRRLESRRGAACMPGCRSRIRPRPATSPR